MLAEPLKFTCTLCPGARFTTDVGGTTTGGTGTGTGRGLLALGAHAPLIQANQPPFGRPACAAACWYTTPLKMSMTLEVPACSAPLSTHCPPTSVKTAPVASVKEPAPFGPVRVEPLAEVVMVSRP